MLRWLPLLLLALLIFSRAEPWLKKMGLGKLPGDLRITVFGRTLFLPLTSSALLAAAAALLLRWL
jgi:Protein of unknown function (DUF2905)